MARRGQSTQARRRFGLSGRRSAVKRRRARVDDGPEAHEEGAMSMMKTLSRILATRAGADIELAIATEDGQTVRIRATDDQIDRLVDELEDILHSPPEAGGDPPAAA